MALKKCKECGNEVSTKAANCPNCGVPIKKKTNISCIGAIFVLVVIAIAYNSISNTLNKTSKQKTEPTIKPPIQKPAAEKPAEKTHAEKLAENIRKTRVALHGEPPESSGWDSSVRCVKRYLGNIVIDPDSLEFEKWGRIMYNDNDGWMVWCQYRAKNSFGGYVRNTNWFIIQNNRVVDMKDFDAYE